MGQATDNATVGVGDISTRYSRASEHLQGGGTGEEEDLLFADRREDATNTSNKRSKRPRVSFK